MYMSFDVTKNVQLWIGIKAVSLARLSIVNHNHYGSLSY